MELERLSSRNLGRDDRVISDHGREARLPFLDENVVSFLNSVPLHIKVSLYSSLEVWSWKHSNVLQADLRLPRGIGEKILLRLVALELGLTQSCTLPKRAIQFGSRIAKTENRKEKGSDVCQRFSHPTQEDCSQHLFKDDYASENVWKHERIHSTSVLFFSNKIFMESIAQRCQIEGYMLYKKCLNKRITHTVHN